MEQALDQSEEIALLSDAQGLRKQFLDSNRCVQEKRLDNLLERALFAEKRGVAVLDIEREEFNYDFTSSLFFVTTFLTTTGYGSTAPLSDEGKLFCVLYCVLGMPITMLLLSCLTQRLLPFMTHVPIYQIQLHWGLPHDQAALVHAVVLLVCTALLFFLLPAAGLCILDQSWSFLDSLYFCFTSVSTIGLADYLPGRSYSPAVRQALDFATTCYLLVGLVVLMVVLETIWELPQTQNLVQLVSGLQEGRLMGFGIEELILSESALPSGDTKVGQVQAEEPGYNLPISTIYSITEEPPVLTHQSSSAPLP